jgi:anaerobic selenocysteine-containing dehydrogenase
MTLDRGDKALIAVLATCGIIIVYMIVHTIITPLKPNATVITPTETFEDCHVGCWGRCGIDLVTKDGQSIHLQGTSTIKWK